MKNNKRGKTLRVIRRCIELTEEHDKGYLARRVSISAISAVRNVVHIWVTARLIDMVISAEPWRNIIVFILITAAVNLALCFAETTVNKRKHCHDFTLEQKRSRSVWEKVLNMDYVHIEKPDTYVERSRMYQAYGRMGRTFYGLTQCATGAANAVTGIVMLIPLILRDAPEAEGFMGFVGSPWGLAALIAVAAAVQTGAGLFESKVGYKYIGETNNDRELIQAERTASHYIDNVLGNYRYGKDIRIYGERELIMSEYETNNETACRKWGKALPKLWRVNCVLSPVWVLQNIMIYGFAALRAISGALSVGEIIGFAMYLTNTARGLDQISSGISDIQIDADFIDGALKFLDIPDEKYKGTIPTEKRDDNEYEFEFKNVWFKYPNSEQYALRDVNLKWRIGEKMALVGKNGCGKSTLVKLLCRLYDPTEGEITLNGIDIRKYKYEDYMALFSVVFQDSGLFSFSIAENVAASGEYDPDEVRGCVERAGLGERLEHMENGIETCLYKNFDEHGVEISGGEAQKLCLARAIYKGAPFIVLDEPTAALDPISEHDIYTKFNGIVGTKTAVYISHRLSSCRFCDEITVMENGTIAERGSHDELVARGGVYGKLWAAQAEYYKDTAGELYM